MKFGGTSVADAERIKRAAGRIVAGRGGRQPRGRGALRARQDHRRAGRRWRTRSPTRPHPREMDMLLSTGERISCALAAMVINDLGHEAISLTGSQAGIVTDTSHTKARILDVRADRIRRALDDGKIVLVAGFQGVSTASDVTTLGPRRLGHHRGGAGRRARRRRLRDLHRRRRRLQRRPADRARRAQAPVVSFEEMLEMAASGAGVLQLRSVEYARNHGIPIHCRSSFEDGPGTFVVDEHTTMERPLVTAVTHSTDEARITLTGLPDRPGIAGRVLTALADANVNVDMIIQNEPESEGAAPTCRSRFRAATSLLRSRRSRRYARSSASVRSRATPDGQGLARRRRNEEPSGRGGQDLHRARRRRREHRDDLDLADQDLVRDPRGARRARRPRAARRLRARRRRDPPRGRRGRPPPAVAPDKGEAA